MSLIRFTALGRLSGLILCVLLVVSTGASSAVAAPLPTLYGESLNATTLSSVEVSPVFCDNTGTTTFSFVATGLATGPYPGTFVVNGTYRIGPHEPWGMSTQVEYDESFTIISGDTTITGTKEVATGDTEPFASGASGQCMRFENSYGQQGRLALGSGLMRYHATFTNGTGSSSVTGLSGTNAFDERYDQQGEVADQSWFVQSFVTKGPAEQVADLIVLVDSYNLRLLGTALHDKLVKVQEFLAANKPKRACEKLDSFLAQVKEQRGKRISVEQADRLTLDARRIKAVIGC